MKLLSFNSAWYLAVAIPCLVAVAGLAPRPALAIAAPDARRAREVWSTAGHRAGPRLATAMPPRAAQSPLTFMLTASSDAGCRCGTSCRIDTRNLSRFAKVISYIDIYDRHISHYVISGRPGERQSGPRDTEWRHLGARRRPASFHLACPLSGDAWTAGPP